MPTPKVIQDRIDELSLYPDRAERIQALIEISEAYDHRAKADVPRTPESKIPGCESEVFFTSSTRQDGTQEYRFAVDNPQGISAMTLAVILETLSGVALDEVAGLSEDIVFEIFGRELSMGKSLGLTNMVKVLRHAASRST